MAGDIWRKSHVRCKCSELVLLLRPIVLTWWISTILLQHHHTQAASQTGKPLSFSFFLFYFNTLGFFFFFFKFDTHLDVFIFIFFHGDNFLFLLVGHLKKIYQAMTQKKSLIKIIIDTGFFVSSL